MDDLAQDSDTDNLDRARRAEATMAAYGLVGAGYGHTQNALALRSPADPDAHDPGPELFLETAGDLLCDLFHLGHLLGVEPTELMDQAFMHYTAEVDEADEEQCCPDFRQVPGANGAEVWAHSMDCPSLPPVGADS